MKKLFIIMCCFVSLLNGMEKEKEKPNVMLGMHYVLLQDDGYIADKRRTFFTDISCMTSYGVVPAYTPEFLRYITNKFNVLFLIDADEQTSIQIVESIFKKVCGANKPQNVQVLAENYLINAEGKKELQPNDTGKISWVGNKKRDITHIGELHNTILIDEHPSWVLRGQESNYLDTPGMSFHLFWEFVSKFQKKDIYEKEIRRYFTDIKHIYGSDLLSFYKLLYVTGILDMACEHPNIVEGLRAIQWEDGIPKFKERSLDLSYYKRGYKVLLPYSDGFVTHRKIIVHLLRADTDETWSVLPHDVRREIVICLIALVRQEMQIFPEIEKYFVHKN